MMNLRYLIGLVVIVSFIVLVFSQRQSNKESSLVNLKIQKNGKIFTLHDLREKKEFTFVYFYSNDCPSCKELIEKIINKNKYLFICIDKKVNRDELKLVDEEVLDIKYVPYIIELNSEYKVVKEISPEKLFGS